MSYLVRTYISRSLLLLFLLLPAAGCSKEEEQRDAIRQKVQAGDYEEATRWAHQYFDDDKRVRLVTLEYIAEQKNKALKEAYKRRVAIQDVQWPSDRVEPGSFSVVGRLINQGDKTITGFGLRIACIKDGKAIHETRAVYAQTVLPGFSTEFRQPVDSFSGCQDVTIQIIDLGIKD